MKELTAQGEFCNQLLNAIQESCNDHGVSIQELRLSRYKKAIHEKKYKVHFEVLQKSPIMYNAAAQARVLRMSESTIADRLHRVNR